MEQISKLLSVILDGQGNVRKQKQCGEWPHVLLPLPLRIHTLSKPTQTESPLSQTHSTWSLKHPIHRK